MAMTRDIADRHVVAGFLKVHGAGWQRRMEMGLGLGVALMINVVVLLLGIRTVEKEGAMHVGVIAEGDCLDDFENPVQAESSCDIPGTETFTRVAQ